MNLNLKDFFRGAEKSAADDAPQLAVAQLLLEIARADADTAGVEIDTIRGYLRRAYGLDDAALDALMATATARVEKAISLYETVSVLNRSLDQDGKSELIRAQWQVAYADGHLDPYEEAMLRRLADLLYVPHSTFIGEKLAVSGG